MILNAAVAFVQERQAERAIDALRRYLPPQATVRRDGARVAIPAREIVVGDVLLLAEGDRVSADARLVSGAVDVDMSALTEESAPVLRSAELEDAHPYPLQARDMVFSGTLCTAGDAVALVRATGMRTELGRIAALGGGRGQSPLEREVKRVAWLVAAIAIAAGLAFLALGTLVAGLPMADAVRFAIGLLVANVPEGLLPTITLALAVGVRALSRRCALVKRLSAVGTLGAATIICTDKTGTLTENPPAAATSPRLPASASDDVSVLVAYATARGSTRGVAERIGARLEAAGRGADVRALSGADTVGDHEAVVLGSPVYDQLWLPAAEAFIAGSADARRRRPLWLFSVGTFGDDRRIRPPRPPGAAGIEQVRASLGLATTVSSPT